MNNDWFREYFINELKVIGRNCIPTDGNQSDWNQNDETALDYVKNRPFYIGDPVETVLVEETTASFVDNGEGAYICFFETTFLPIAGETYKVSWDGTVYESICASFNDTFVIGNLSFVGLDDTGEPFIVVIDPGGFGIITPDTSDSHTFSISEMVPSVVKIDPKYLPDNPDNPLNITGGAVGQIAKIAAVDDSGKPTAWESADLSSAVTDDHINELINTALSAIGIAEEGAY